MAKMVRTAKKPIVILVAILRLLKTEKVPLLGMTVFSQAVLQSEGIEDVKCPLLERIIS
jgi:hypothetical protein